MTAKSNAREGDGVGGLPAKWREGADALDAMMFDSARAARIECYRSCADQLEAMQAQQGAEPVGFVLVPRQMTGDIARAFADAPTHPDGRMELQFAWDAMLAAAPATGAPR